jgi:hypothetical protein
MGVQAVKNSGDRRQSFGGLNVLCIGLLLAYFFDFAVPALRGGFADDEMMNLYLYWLAGPLKSIEANLCFWSTFPPRPAGALYYLPLYHFFSLDPLPYRFVQISILAATIPIIFCLAHLLSGSRAVAFLVALAMCYHGQMGSLVFTGSFIYDVLCGLFYFGALSYYVDIREKGLALRPARLALFLALYIFALNSKEMAVSLPVIVFLYELLKARRADNWKEFARRNWHLFTPSLVAALITAIYIFGKLTGPSSLANSDAYRPVFSLHRFTVTNAHFINDLLYHSASHTGRLVLLAWPAVLLYAFWRGDRLLQLMAIWVVVTPLPLAFIPGRGGAMLYILLFGWATILARMASDVIGLIGKLPVRPSQAAILRSSAIAAAAFALAVFTHWQNQRFDTTRGLLNSGQKSLHVIQAFRSLGLHPKPGSGILLRPEKRFYQNGYYPLFVAALVWNDHSLRIYVDGQRHVLSEDPPAVGIAKYGVARVSYVISFSEFEAKLLPAQKPDHG